MSLALIFVLYLCRGRLPRANAAQINFTIKSVIRCFYVTKYMFDSFVSYTLIKNLSSANKKLQNTIDKFIQLLNGGKSTKT